MAILRGSGRSRVWISRKATCKLHRAHADTQIVRRVRMQGGTAQRNVHSMIVESVDPAEFGSSVVPCAGGLPLPANLEPRPGVRAGRGGWMMKTSQQCNNFPRDCAHKATHGPRQKGNCCIIPTYGGHPPIIAFSFLLVAEEFLSFAWLYKIFWFN